MSLPDPAPARKPRRLGLYLPFALLLILMAGWTGVWLWARGEALRRIDAAVADLQRAGFQVGWKGRSLAGYPFRLNLTLTDLRVREPSGWALETPRLEAQGYMHAPSHWLAAAPADLTFVRPIGGQVLVKGKVIRASLSHLDKRPPNFDFEGVGLTFQPLPGAQPFFLSAADRVEFHLRAAPSGDEGGVFLEVRNGKARLSGLFARVAGDKPISIAWNATLSKVSAFAGRNWPEAVRAWADAGGVMTVRQSGVTAGEATIGSQSGTLSVGHDGRLTGVLEVTLREAPRALGVMGETGVIPPERAEAAAAVAQARQGASDAARASLSFQAGQTTLGPVAIGPAPKVYEVR
jgi:hypothetical protein